MYLSEGLEARSVDPKVALRYLTLAVKNFEDALTHNTSSKGLLKIILNLDHLNVAVFSYFERMCKSLVSHARRASKSNESAKCEKRSSCSAFQKDAVESESFETCCSRTSKSRRRTSSVFRVRMVFFFFFFFVVFDVETNGGKKVAGESRILLSRVILKKQKENWPCPTN